MVVDKIYCLTLANDRERQLSAVSELSQIGLKEFEFVLGVTATDNIVDEYFQQQKVFCFPPCFRCGMKDCGDDNCNNILTPTQVAVGLSYRKIFKRILDERVCVALLIEDDIKFFPYAEELIEKALSEKSLTELGVKTDRPVLIRLTEPFDLKKIDEFKTKKVESHSFDKSVVMSNPCFLVNAAFAKLAYDELDIIRHTADVIIHRHLTDKADCWTLNPPLVYEKSWATGELPSRIHPKQVHIDYLKSAVPIKPDRLIEAQRAFDNYIKKAHHREFKIIGSPSCGSYYVSKFLTQNGVKIGHEQLGSDGVCAWMLATSDDNYPYVTDKAMRSGYFLNFDKTIIYARCPATAIPSLIIENQKATMSYDFRRKKIYEEFRVDIDILPNEIARAAASYAYWYKMSLKHKYQGVLQVENLLADSKALFGSDFVEPLLSDREEWHSKPYLGEVYLPKNLPYNWKRHLTPSVSIVLQEVSEELGYSLMEID